MSAFTYLSSTVLNRPDLLAHHIQAQYLPALTGDDDATLEDRREARLLVRRLAGLRREPFADTLDALLAD